MIKEIYISTEDFDVFDVRAVAMHDFLSALTSMNYFTDDIMYRDDYKKLYHTDSVTLDVYGYDWESSLIELLAFVDPVESMEDIDYPKGRTAADIFQSYADFCRKHNDRGNVLLIG